MPEDYVPFPQLKKVSSGFNLQGLDLRLSPFTQPDGEFIRLIDVDPYPQGALSKRPGYGTLLGTSTGSTVNCLFDWHQDNGTTFWLYKCSGSNLEYSIQGTGAWTLAGAGTIAAGSAVGFGTLNNTLILGDGSGSTRHTTNGTAFTNTTGAPVARYFTEYNKKIWAAFGTNPTISASVTGDPTNWATSGTSDGTTVTITGGGGFNSLMTVSNRMVATKTSGDMYRWDSYNLLDMSLTTGPTSALSIGKIGDYRIYLNRRGYFGFDGDTPNIISNAIQPQIYNSTGSAIAGGTFDLAPAVAYKYDYYCAVGTVTDDLTREVIPNCLQIYNYQYNQWRNYSTGTPVTALWSYKDGSFNEQLIFGDNAGQCYTLGGTNLSDNGLPIESIIEYVYHGGIPEYDKAWDYGWFFFNPGCKARAQVAISSTWTKERLQWMELGDLTDGIKEFHFKGAKGRLMFVKIIDSSVNTRFTFYGHAVQFRVVVR